MAGTNWHYKVIDKNDIIVTKYSSLKNNLFCKNSDVGQGWFFCVDRTSSFTNLHGKKGKIVSKNKKKKFERKFLSQNLEEKKRKMREKERQREKQTHHSVYAIKRFFAKDGNIEECVWFDVVG